MADNRGGNSLRLYAAGLIRETDTDRVRHKRPIRFE